MSDMRLSIPHNRERRAAAAGPSRASTTTGSRASRAASSHNRKATETSSNAVWTGTHINDLKSLAHQKIFTFLTKEELQTTRRVCRMWYNLINKEFGIKVAINNSNAELIWSCPWIVDLVLINLTRPVLPQGVVCASRLKVLNISGMVVSYNLIPLLQSSLHLQALTFSEPNIDLPDYVILRTFPSDIHLREVKKLTFESWNYTDSISTIARVLSAVSFGQLKEIYVRAVHPPVLPLAHIFVTPEDAPEDDSPMIQLIKQNLNSIETISLGTMLSQSTLVFVPNSVKPGEPIQLKELNVQNLYMNWTAMLQNQSQIVNLSVGHCQTQQWPEIRSCITKCASQLETLKLQGRTFGLAWDFDVFSECRNLRDVNINLTLSPKQNLNSLPRTITHLSMDGPIDRSEFLQIYNLINLVKLQLNCLGLNFVILQLQQQQANNPPPDLVDLVLFLGLMRRLPNLLNLTFKDCSQESLEWDKINSWCRRTVSHHPRLVYTQHDFEMHGQRIQHGFTLTIPSFFSRSLLNIPALPEQTLPGRSVVGSILHFFGLRN